MLATNASGKTVDDHGYNAYGRDRRGSELRTAQRFTGQQSDGTGLIYMNARYYDPQLGQFISPDTLVPDANNVMDFNRYAYARGNPMKYNDPSGHCVTNKDGSRAKSDAQCWQLVDTISAIWNQHPNYWDQRFKVSNESWLEKVAAAQPFDSKYMNNELNLYLHSDSFKSDFGFTPDGYTPGSVPSHPIEQFNDKICNVLDCVAVGLDVASLVLSAGGDTAIGCTVATAGAAAGLCIPVAGVAKVADAGIAVISVAHTGDMLRQGKASRLDFYVTAATARVSVVPGLGEAAGIVQLSYDLSDPFLSVFIPNTQVNK